ncbi:MAG: protein kinase [Myxococcota bacterium]|jgi:serine/threonine-protein kinase|nr:protein kinase [Myxococcota bacterium]
MISVELPLSPSLPERFGRYEVAALLATGGMAEVYLAKLVGPERFERAVVVKRILPHLARDEAFRAMFLDEARLAALIHHPNVVTVHELAQSEGELFLVMDYVEGETLAAILKRLAKAGHAMPMHVAVHVLAEACAGLHAAHELVDEERRPRGIVHRDVSPQNLMVDYHGTVRVLDFGIASAADRSTSTQSGVVKGKFAYMSPEQARAQKVDRQTDVFALGVVLYEVTTSSRLFARPDSLAVVRAICEEPIPSPRDRRPSYPHALEDVLMKALHRDKSERYATAAEMRRGLLGVLRELDPEGRAPEDLAALMSEHFSAQQKEKRDLLRKASASDSHVTRAPSLAEGDRGTRRSYLGLGGAALALVCGLGGAYLGLRDSDAAANERNEATEPATATRVRLQVATTPVGAAVSIDGEAIGVTPLDVTRPRTGRAHELHVTHEGFEPRVESWTADVDQRLRVDLRALAPDDESTGTSSAGTSSTGTPSTGTSSTGTSSTGTPSTGTPSTVTDVAEPTPDPSSATPAEIDSDPSDAPAKTRRPRRPPRDERGSEYFRL